MPANNNNSNCSMPRLFALLSIGVASLFMLSALTAQEINPLAGQPRAAYAGGVLFRAYCATCHGADARGIDSIDAPDLTAMWQDKGYSEGQVYRLIEMGIPGTIMPAHGFNETELWMLVSFLRSEAISGVAELPAGDAERGEELFRALCQDCHRVGDEGGVLGPNLTDLLERQDLEGIMAALRQPSARISSDYRAVRLATTEGEYLEGILRNEDAFSLQIMDQSQRLLAFRKADLNSWQVLDQSVMPAYAPTELSENAVIDLLNFIDSVGNGGNR